MSHDHLKYAELTSQIIGSAIFVHQTLGCGFQELIYQRALEIEMNRIKISFTREQEMPILYRNEKIGTRRATSKLEAVHFAQAMNYLEVYNLEIGLLINFGEPSLNFKRFTNKKLKPLLTIPITP